MDSENPSALTRTQSRIPGKNHPQRPHRNPYAGVVHDNSRHTSRFTVIGNHLAQHPELSGLAIGIAVHIQSLPTGAPVDIKTLAARFPEGAKRIASVLHELETHGYLTGEQLLQLIDLVGEIRKLGVLGLLGLHGERRRDDVVALRPPRLALAAALRLEVGDGQAHRAGLDPDHV